MRQTDDHIRGTDNIAYRGGNHFFCMKWSYIEDISYLYFATQIITHSATPIEAKNCPAKDSF